MAKKRRRKKYRGFWIWVRIQIVLLVFVGVAVGWYFFGGYAAEVKELKAEAHQLVRQSDKSIFRQNQTTIVYASDGTLISTLSTERDSYYLEYDEIPSTFVDAIVSIEDKKFFKHNGVDFLALVRALKSFIDEGEATQGGSTITMQLARNTFLTQEKTWQRKVEEIFIARELEQKYSKEQILEFYLNDIYFGNGYYGICAASIGYFDSEPSELDLSQVAFLCAIPNNPTLYDPFTNIENVVSRRDRILSNMLSDGKISQTTYDQASSEEITLKRPEAMAKNDYVETYAYYCATRALMEQEGFVFQYYFATDAEESAYDEEYASLYAECQNELYTGGYRVYTSLNLDFQEELQAAVCDTLADFTDVNDEGIYEMQASAVCIDNSTGRVVAIVGGRNQEYDGYTLNRAYQSFRQPGSAIKPLLVYTPSFERGYTPDSIVVDEPIEGGPRNSNGVYLGEITIRTAVEKSVNTIAWKLYDELTPEKGLAYLKEMNFSKIDAEDYRTVTALGGFTYGASALEMAAGFATLENDGKYRTPTCIIKIEDASGNVVYASSQEEKQVYKQNAARMMTDVLTGVMTEGTGKGVSLSDMPCAGKTGTTSNYWDGWMVGYTRYYTTSVWVGCDMPKKVSGLQGATYPGTIWQTFMEEIHEGLEPLDFLGSAKLSDELTEKISEEKEAAAAAEEEINALYSPGGLGNANSDGEAEGEEEGENDAAEAEVGEEEVEAGGF